MSFTLRAVCTNLLFFSLSQLSTWRGVSYRSRDTEALTHSLTRAHTPKGMFKNFALHQPLMNASGKDKTTAKKCAKTTNDASAFRTSLKATLDRIQPHSMRKRDMLRLAPKVTALTALMRKASKQECEDVAAENVVMVRQYVKKKIDQLLASNPDLKKKCSEAREQARKMLASIGDPPQDSQRDSARLREAIQIFVTCEKSHMEVRNLTRSIERDSSETQAVDSEDELEQKGVYGRSDSLMERDSEVQSSSFWVIVGIVIALLFLLWLFLSTVICGINLVWPLIVGLCCGVFALAKWNYDTFSECNHRYEDAIPYLIRLYCFREAAESAVEDAAEDIFGADVNVNL
eukprot:TRINITY_DN35095_c0_g1_i1.p1 TRINITY_DN35095_c0_g1~~TRINITY_DN35095_c0_g1_i1.p1  ORF type:complete len:346 (+),score=34.15 TRINITY_DN35095_c0_g1_i1:73-1110(+)